MPLLTIANGYARSSATRSCLGVAAPRRFLRTRNPERRVVFTRLEEIRNGESRYGLGAAVAHSPAFQCIRRHYSQSPRSNRNQLDTWRKDLEDSDGHHRSDTDGFGVVGVGTQTWNSTTAESAEERVRTRSSNNTQRRTSDVVQEPSQEQEEDNEEVVEEEDMGINLEALVTGRDAEQKRMKLRKDGKSIERLTSRKTSESSLRRMLCKSPSIDLERALSEAKDPRLLPRFCPAQQHDLSYRFARNLEAFNLNAIHPNHYHQQPSLQAILAERIRFKLAKSSDPSAPPLPLSSEQRLLFDKFRIEIDQVDTWAEALLEPNSELAARKLASNSRLGKDAPWFLLTFLLRRGNIRQPALSLLLELSENSLEARYTAIKTQQSDELPSTRMVLILCIRLMRHARDHWPEAFPQIADIWTKYLDLRSQYFKARGKLQRSSVLRKLAFKSNRLLSQMSLPGKRRPVLSAIYQQRAQFDIIRSMMEYDPPLPLSQEGHRALTKVLIQQKKTDQERDWASLKVRSWPPFKRSKTSFDDVKDREYGLSAAGQSIEYMLEYGYALKNWDLMATIYSGWSPDGTPVYQTRGILPPVATSAHLEPSLDVVAGAIIRVARTIPEAWAAFLKFDELHPGAKGTHMAMMKRLLYLPHVEERQDTNLSSALIPVAWPGDRLEAWSPPTSPMEAVYTASKPPSPDTFLTTLINNGVSIHGAFMRNLLIRAPNFEFGLRVLMEGKAAFFNKEGGIKYSDKYHGLLDPSKTAEDILPHVQEHLFEAIIAFFTRFNRASTESLAGTSGSSSIEVGSSHMDKKHMLVHAYRLTALYGRLSGPAAYNSMLKAMMYDHGLVEASIGVGRRRRKDLQEWALTKMIFEDLDAKGISPDHTSMQTLFGLGARAALGAKVVLATSRRLDMAAAEDMLAQGSRLLRHKFARFVGLEGGLTRGLGEPRYGRSKPPILLEAFGLHWYVRALGILGDFEGIYSCVQWMVSVADQLQQLQEASIAGRHHMRRLIVAIRVYTECPSREFNASKEGIDLQPASEELIQLVKAAVESVELWGGWATDQEVYEFCLPLGKGQS